MAGLGLDALIIIIVIVGAVVLYFVAKFIAWLFVFFAKLFIAYVILVGLIILLGIKPGNLEWVGMFAGVFIVFLVLSLFNK